MITQSAWTLGCCVPSLLCWWAASRLPRPCERVLPGGTSRGRLLGVAMVARHYRRVMRRAWNPGTCRAIPAEAGPTWGAFIASALAVARTLRRVGA